MIKSALDNLSLEKFIYYLQSCGWTQVPYNNDRMIVFARTETEGEPSDLVTLPASEKYTDSAVRIAEAVKRLADIEETTPQDIIGRIHSAEQDIISYAVFCLKKKKNKIIARSNINILNLVV